MSDLLLEAAKEYKELMNYEYVISGGTGSLAAGQQKFLTILKEERINIHTKEVVVLFDRLSDNSTQ